MVSEGGSVSAYPLESRMSETSLSSIHHASPYRDSLDVDDVEFLETPHLSNDRTSSRKGWLERLWLALTAAQRRRHSVDYFRSRDMLRDGLLSNKPFPPRESRSCRRSYCGSFLKRAVLLLPAFALMVFGVLHVSQYLYGRTRLFWDPEAYDKFLPEWGLPGHAGADIVHYPTEATRDVIPIRCHSHNDYWRRVPLFEALHWGCTGVEADVWLFDEELYVGHNTASLTKNRTFRNLYVNPLVDLLDHMNQNTTFANTTGHGVFDERPEQALVLLVDFKTGGRETFPHVYKQLEPLREKGYLSYWDGKQMQERAITVVGTGNTPFDMVVSETERRDIFFDAPLDRLWEAKTDRDDVDKKLDTVPLDMSSSSGGQGQVGTGMVTSADEFNSTNSYYASVSFMKTVGFVWRGHLSVKQLDIIRGQIRGAHQRGLKARYWDTPAWPINTRNHIWHILMREGADMLSVDDLKAAATVHWLKRVHGLW